MDGRPTEMYQNTPCNDMRIIFFDPHVVFDFWYSSIFNKHIWNMSYFFAVWRDNDFKHNVILLESYVSTKFNIIVTRHGPSSSYIVNFYILIACQNMHLYNIYETSLFTHNNHK